MSFSSSGLKLNGATVYNPTSLQFGPDNRLYIAEQAGFIRIYTVRRDGPNDYSVIGFQTITLVNTIPNHNDDGALNSAITHRQITGILLRGTAANPIIYVSSSDSRIGGPSGETNLDTNSGMVSMLTWNGTAWVKIDLVRGLPRSEENHSVNGMQLDDQTNTLFLAVGGHTNAGAPSTNFNFTTEYALSAAILSINLNAIMALPTKGSGNNAYKYDLPTLDDPTRANNPDGSDINDPFGGNDGLNQAMLVAGGPVQIYSAGYRNPYDIVLTKSRRLYTVDNGANQGWGGYPAGEGTANVNNNYVSGEPGSTSGTATEALVNNLDNFHYIGAIDNYTPRSFYGGHPAPVRANPAGAGLYTHDGTTGVFRTSTTGPNPLPANWPPVPASMADTREGDFRMPGTGDGSPLTFSSSTNGIAEYTASNFNGALKGSLLAAEYNGSIALIKLTADGTGVTNAKNPTTKLNQEPPFASNFGATPLDVIAQGDNDIFPGTVWAITYGAHEVTIFEPQDIANCTGANNNLDEDGDGYTNADEIANGTGPCSGSSKPADSDGDHISDLNDPDDDNDGINDKLDAFAIDASNGSATAMPVSYNLFNNDPGTGFFGLGFTGLMSNSDSDYLRQFDSENLIAGGAVGAFSVVDVAPGDALGTLNTQKYAFQFGVQTGGLPFTLRSRMTGPFFNNQTPQGSQSQGIYLGNGDQDNYLKIVLNANGGAGGIQVVYENAGTAVSSQYPITGGIPASQLDLILKFNPTNNTVQPAYISGTNGAVINVGAPIAVSGAVLNALRGGTVLAVGVISTSKGGPAFTATWDYIYINGDPVTATGSWQTITPASGAFTGREENAYVQAGDKFYLIGGRGNKPVQEYNPVAKTWVDKAYQPMELHHFQAVTLDGLVYVAGAFTGSYPHETPVANLYIYNPASNKWLTGPGIPQARRRGATGAVAHNGKIYVVGGITDGHWAGWVKWFDEYDPATNTWRTLPDAPRERDHVQVTVVNNKLYVAGGRRSSASTNQDFDLAVAEVDVFDFATGTWSTLPASSNIPTPRSGACNVALGEEVIVIGGESATQTAAHAETQAFNTRTNTWRTLANLQQGRHGSQAIANNGGIFTATGAGNRGGTPILTTQEVFYFYTPTTPDGTPLVQSNLSAPTTLNFGTAALNNAKTQTLVLSNTTGNQALLVSALTISGSNAFAVNGPTLPFFIPAGKTVTLSVSFTPTAAGSQTANLVVTHSGQNAATTTVLNGTGSTVAHRINAGGAAVTNSIGDFTADQYYYPAPGTINSVTNAINNTADDAMYQSERYGRDFDYNFPVANGQYKVVLHFAELYWTATGKRLFDVSIEGVKKLDNYDIVAKTGGAFNAITENFVVTVTDGTLNIHFSALAADGGLDNAKISAIEILSSNVANEPPVSDAGPDKTITLPTNSVVLNGSGTDAGGAIAAYTWTQLSGPNTATFSSKTVATPTVSGLVQGTYVFSLVVTDNEGATSAANQVSVIVNPAASSGSATYRINAGGPQLTTSVGTFTADQYFSSSNVAQTTTAINGTTDDALYQTERWGGSFSCNFPVSNGQYKVILHFAEFTYPTIGRRIFDVSMEGVKKLDNYDITAKAGAYTAISETITINVTDGTLNILFSSLPADGGKNYAKVSAIEVLPLTSNNTVPVANAGADKTLTLPANSVALSGSGTDSDGTVTAYTWSQVSGPNTATFSSNSTATPTVSGLVQGSYVFALVVSDNGGAMSQPDQVTVIVNPAATGAAASYRINAGGTQVTNSIGTFAADNYYNNATGGGTFVSTAAINGTTDDAIYQSERWGYNFGYTFPVANGQYKVVLHFAEVYWTTPGSRVFDVSIEGVKKLDNYDIVAKVGGFTATTETFTISVTDGNLNIDLSSLAGDGGVDNAKISAIEVLPMTPPPSTNKAPISNAGADQTITLPTSSTTLLGSAKDVDGTVASYHWAQVSGPNTATFSNPNMHKPVVSGLVAGTYVFALTATDNLGATGAPDQMTVTVNPAAVTSTGRSYGSPTTLATSDATSRKPVKGEDLEAADAFGVKAYPNPTSTGRISIQFSEPVQGDLFWTLHSPAGGRMAAARQMLSYASSALQIDLSKYGLPPGVYFLEVTAGARRNTIRIIVSGR